MDSHLEAYSDDTQLNAPLDAGDSFSKTMRREESASGSTGGSGGSGFDLRMPASEDRASEESCFGLGGGVGLLDDDDDDGSGGSGGVCP